MSNLTKLNLNEFLKEGNKNYINIYFDETYFQKIYHGFDFEHFMGVWLFFNKEPELSLLSIDASCEIQLNDKIFNIKEFGFALVDAYYKWQQDFPDLIFPNITIVSKNYIKNSGSFIAYDSKIDNHLIYFDIDDLNSIEQFKFVLGHELGHIYFRKKMSEEYQKVPHTFFKNLFPNEVFIFTLINVFVAILSFFYSNSINFMVLTIISLFYISFFLINLLTAPTRFYNYSMEFFCDYFSYHFFSNDKLDSSFLKNHGDSISHPSGSLRKFYNNNFEYKDLKEWKSPVNGRRFRIISLRELIIIIDNCIALIENKFNKIQTDLIKKN